MLLCGHWESYIEIFILSEPNQGNEHKYLVQAYIISVYHLEELARLHQRKTPIVNSTPQFITESSGLVLLEIVVVIRKLFASINEY